MNGKENIINKILSDADAKCNAIVTAAEAEASSIKKTAEAVIAHDRVELDKRISATSAERIRNRIATAELDGKKYRLNAKQQLISRCYQQAYESLRNMSDKERAKLIGSLIDRYAEKGETVYITQRDANVVTQLFLDGFDKNLTLGKKYLKADGGIVLEGVGYEKDLTLSRVISYAREQTEAKVAASLLGVTNE